MKKTPHAILILELTNKGIKGSAIQWLYSFLLDRTRQVRLGNNLSSVIRVTSDVAEDAVLGPNLFNVVVGSLHRLIRRSHVGYADDLNLYITSPSTV